MGQNGGARPGAGFPKGQKKKVTLNREEQKAVLRELLSKHDAVYVASLVDAMIAREVPALKEFSERRWGKEAAAVDVTSGGEKLPTPILSAIEIIEREDSE